jgi:uncharacterized protein YqgV (UPF0045/DUF77 family)
MVMTAFCTINVPKVFLFGYDSPCHANYARRGLFSFPDTKGRSAMIVEFSIRPIRQTSSEQVLADGSETVHPAPTNGRPRSMSASIEGSWDEVMSVIRGCHQAHINGHPRVVTTIVVVDDNVNGHINGWPRLLHDMVPPVRVQSGHGTQHVRRIPVDCHQ